MNKTNIIGILNALNSLKPWRFVLVFVLIFVFVAMPEVPGIISAAGLGKAESI